VVSPDPDSISLQHRNLAHNLLKNICKAVSPSANFTGSLPCARVFPCRLKWRCRMLKSLVVPPFLVFILLFLASSMAKAAPFVA